jgi:hypothetical protein
MTYCVGILTRSGLVVAADSRSNAGLDHIATVRKLALFEQPDARVMALLPAGNLATTQAVVTLLQQRQDGGGRRISTPRSRCSMPRAGGGHCRSGGVTRPGRAVDGWKLPVGPARRDLPAQAMPRVCAAVRRARGRASARWLRRSQILDPAGQRCQ